MAPDPWLQQPGESAQAFHAFEHYLTLEPRHRSRELAWSMHAVCRGLDTGSVGALPGRWAKWSQDRSWAQRVDAYDAHVQAVQQAGADAELEEAGREAAKVGRRFLAVAERSIDRLEEAMRADTKLRPSVTETTRLAQVGANLAGVAGEEGKTFEDWLREIEAEEVGKE